MLSFYLFYVFHSICSLCGHKVDITLAKHKVIKTEFNNYNKNNLTFLHISLLKII